MASETGLKLVPTEATRDLPDLLGGDFFCWLKSMEVDLENCLFSRNLFNPSHHHVYS